MHAEPALDAAGQWFHGMRRWPSPNCDARPAGTAIDLVVVHGISLPPGEFGGDGVERLFTNRIDAAAHPALRAVAALRVSAHLYVDRRGQVTQYVAIDRRAWHAGVSSWQGRAACNDYSVGIEFEGTDHIDYEPVQYRVGAALVRALARRHPRITAARCVGHEDVAPGRKTDPGPAFDWTRFRRLIRAGGVD